MKSTEHVLIIGGGIGGMTLAAALHKVGITFDVYEQAPELTEVGAGVGLWSNVLFSLEQIGVAERVRQHYEATRLERTTMIVRRSWQFGYLTGWTNPLAVWLREQFVRFTPRRVLEGELRRQGLETVGTLTK